MSLRRSRSSRDNFEMGDSLIERRQDGSRFWADHSLFRFHAGKLPDRLHRVPQCEDDKFDRVVDGAPQQVGTAMPVNLV